MSYILIELNNQNIWNIWYSWTSWQHLDNIGRKDDVNPTSTRKGTFRKLSYGTSHYIINHTRLSYRKNAFTVSTNLCVSPLQTQISRSSDGSEYEVIRGCNTSPVCTDVSYSVGDQAYIVDCCDGDRCNGKSHERFLSPLGAIPIVQ